MAELQSRTLQSDLSASMPVDTSQVPKFRYFILIWLFLIMIVNYMDRVSISIAAPKMIEDLGLTQTDIGLLGAMFSWVYAVFQLPSGYLIDKLGPKRMYYLSLTLWSIATALMAFGKSMAEFLTFRFLLGVGESPNSPNCSKITTEWFPRSERGQAAGIWDSGSKWGPAIAPPLLTAIMLAFGWRAMFVIVGLSGIILAIAFFLYYRSPEESRHLTEAEYRYILLGRDDRKPVEKVDLPWLKFFVRPQTWGMMLGFFGSIWVWNIFLTFLPLYLEKGLGITIAMTGLLAALPFVSAGVGEMVGGRITLMLVQRFGFTPMRSKKVTLVTDSILIGIILILTPLVASAAAAITLLCVALFFVAMLHGQSWALTTDIVPDSHAARFGSIMNFGGYFGGALSPILTGYIYDTWHSYAPSFIIAGVISIFGACCYGFLVKGPLATLKYD